MTVSCHKTPVERQSLMSSLKPVLTRAYEELNIVKEKIANYGGLEAAPLNLRNQLAGYELAIELISPLISTTVTQKDLDELKDELKRTLVSDRIIESIGIAEVKPEKPHLPFEPETVPVPAGSFLMGRTLDPDIPAEETPPHFVELPAYNIGKTPVTNAQYAEFIKQNPEQAVPKKAGWFLREPPAKKLDHPVVGLNWFEAKAYCDWLSGETERNYRLPTEAEWEKAASYTLDQEKRSYPWGSNFNSAWVNSSETGLNSTTPVGQFSPNGDSFVGCADLAGNVQEWTSTLWGSDLICNDYPYPYNATDGREDLAAGKAQSRVFCVHRGGSYRDDQSKIRTTTRSASDPDSKIKWRGFRVVCDG